MHGLSKNEIKGQNLKILLLAFIWLLLGILIIVLILVDEPDVIIEWETESEFETIGFNLWRKKATQDEFEQINDQLIPSSSDPASGSSYQFLDSDIERGITYYYLIEDIDYDGSSTQHEEYRIEVPHTNPILFVAASICIAIGLVLGVTNLPIMKPENRANKYSDNNVKKQ